MPFRSLLTTLSVGLIVVSVAACGQMGPLYQPLPEPPAEESSAEGN